MNAHADPHAKGEHINVPVFPNPDVVQLERFADAIFKHADPRGFVSLRAFAHRDNTPPIFIEPIP
jgi:hypothetical protein